MSSRSRLCSGEGQITAAQGNNAGTEPSVADEIQKMEEMRKQSQGGWGSPAIVELPFTEPVRTYYGLSIPYLHR